ncbi:MAG: hypothetical protein U9R21_06680, partial [Candidatus Thermoplasmatota archaeon]|nr:hypothetical protein [Candidatus Thermoplasmatota archaeon]
DDSQFYKDSIKNDGLSSYCKDCKREYHREYRKSRLEAGLCYDCGKPRPEGWNRYCPDCLKKREELNKIYEKERVAKGLCRQCGKNPIDYSRSKLHCTECLDKRNR